jgi:anti-sigma B factor antagonist
MANDSGCVKEVRREGKAILVALQGGVDLHQTPAVHKELVSACEQRPSRLVVSLKDVEYLDSSGLGTLVEVFRRVKGYGGKFILCCANERVKSVFEITKLDKFFQIYATEEEAMGQ